MKRAEKLRKGQQGVFRSFGHAYRGIIYAVRTQRNLRFHLFAATGVLVLSLLVGVSVLELALLVLVILAVVVTEMLNTAVEFAVDLSTREFHPLAKLAKDISAGAVLVASVGAVAVGLLVLGDDLRVFIEPGLAGIRALPAYLTLASLVLAAVFTVSLKALWPTSDSSAKPATVLATALANAAPSGHAAAAFAAWGAVSFLSAGGRYAGILFLLTLLLALLVCQSRIEARNQSFLQVVSGAVVGMLTTVAVFQLL